MPLGSHWAVVLQAAPLIALLACGNSEAIRGGGACPEATGEPADSLCALNRDSCTACIQADCADETIACQLDPGCTEANQRLLTCGCWAQTTSDASALVEAETAFRQASPVAARALSCGQRRCAEWCRL